VAGASRFKKEKLRVGLLEGTYQELPQRGLTMETLRKFGYQLGQTSDGTPCHIAPYCNRDGEVIAQKLRKPGKEFSFAGDPKQVFQLFGQRLWGSKGRRVVVTEGEIDCMSVSQVLEHKWPVVSVVNGAGDEQGIKRSLEWLESFDEVVFMFDADKPGREGAAKAAQLLSPGKAKIAALPDGTDPNELLVEGNRQSIITGIYEAKTYRPDALRSLADLITEASKPVEWGAALPWEPLYLMSYGPKPGKLWVGGAGVGIGKTDLFTECEAFDLQRGIPVAIVHLEQSPPETVQRLAAKITGKPYFAPDCEYTEEELAGVMKPYLDLCHIYDHRGCSDWDEIKRHLRWAARGFGIKHAYVDNLTVLTADAEDERRYLDMLMKDMKSLAEELGIFLHVLSHLNTPDGTPHEEGGRVQAKQFAGSRAIMRYADYMWGLERDTQADDEEARKVSTFRVLKDRLTGRSNGQTFHLKYDPATTRQTVCAAPPKKESEPKAEDYHF
jgi:twinkle protein